MRATVFYTEQARHAANRHYSATVCEPLDQYESSEIVAAKRTQQYVKPVNLRNDSNREKGRKNDEINITTMLFFMYRA